MSDGLSDDALKLINAVFTSEVKVPAKFAPLVMEVQEWSKEEHDKRFPK